MLASVWRFHENGREILGFISYVDAQMLLRLARIEEFLRFLYSHRYHAHTRGSWSAGEVTGITGESGTYCVPAQQTIPLLVRWMLVLEDSEDSSLHLAKGVPRNWFSSDKEIGIEHAPTRWGRVSFKLVTKHAAKSVTGKVELSGSGAPEEVHFKLRLPAQTPLVDVLLNGQPTTLQGTHKDTVVIKTGSEGKFEVPGRLS